MIDMDKMISLAEKYNLHPKAKDNNNLDVNPPPEGHYRYIYRWTNLTSGMWYVGKHSFIFGDAYAHSSENKKFLKDWYNPNINWKYEIMEYVQTTDDNLSDIEYEKLSSMHDPKTGKGGAAANLMSYNKSNGIPSTKLVKPVDIKKIKLLVDRIKNNSVTNEFPISDYEIDLLLKMIQELRRIQSRAGDEPKDIKDISHSIVEEGSTINCNPVIL
jgi:hypothetical protein